MFAACTSFVAAGLAGSSQDIVQPTAISFNCDTRLPVGRRQSEVETTSLPPISVTIGNIVMGQVKYVPGVALHVKISYGEGQASNMFIKAETVFGSEPVGNWAILSGEVDAFSCSSSADSLVGTSLSKAGLMDLYWTSPIDCREYIEIQITVTNRKGQIWMWNSFLLEAS